MNEASSSTIMRGQLIAERYQILQTLGEGATGHVYLAEDTRLGNQRVALKFLHSHLLFSEESYGRFLNETRVTMSLNHPHILQTYGMGRHGTDHIYLQMEYLEGESLDERLARHGAFTAEEAIPLLRDIAAGLEYAHRCGVVHRDLKPANILLTEDDRAKIADFGLAQMIRIEARYTGFGDILGTPYYMSPEQLRSEIIDSRSDIYSFGILAYEILTASHPFEADSFLELAELHFNEPLPAFDAPLWLQELIQRCCKKERMDRYPRFDDIFRVLDEQSSIPALTSKSSLGRSPQVTQNISNQVAPKTHFTLFGLSIPKQSKLLGLGNLRLKLFIGILLLTITVPLLNKGVRWRYAAVALSVERFVGFELPVLRLIFRTPLDLRYPDSFFVGAEVVSHAYSRNYFRPLLLLGYDPNILNPKTNTFPINTLINRGVSFQIVWFLHHGADPNLIDPEGMTTVGHMVNARYGIVSRRDLEVLLDNGANPNLAGPNTIPPLAQALLDSQKSVAKTLVVKGGARGDVPSRHELPILHLAIRTRDAELVSLLLEQGLVPSKIRSAKGQNALEYARELAALPGVEKVLQKLEAAESQAQLNAK